MQQNWNMICPNCTRCWDQFLIFSTIPWKPRILVTQYLAMPDSIRWELYGPLTLHWLFFAAVFHTDISIPSLSLSQPPFSISRDFMPRYGQIRAGEVFPGRSMTKQLHESLMETQNPSSAIHGKPTTRGATGKIDGMRMLPDFPRFYKKQTMFSDCMRGKCKVGQFDDEMLHKGNWEITWANNSMQIVHWQPLTVDGSGMTEESMRLQAKVTGRGVVLCEGTVSFANLCNFQVCHLSGVAGTRQRVVSETPFNRAFDLGLMATMKGQCCANERNTTLLLTLWPTHRERKRKQFFWKMPPTDMIKWLPSV